MDGTKRLERAQGSHRMPWGLSQLRSESKASPPTPTPTVHLQTILWILNINMSLYHSSLVEDSQKQPPVLSTHRMSTIVFKDFPPHGRPHFRV